MIEIRRPRLLEQAAVNALVQTVVREVYATETTDFEDWTLGWGAFSGSEIIGIVHAIDDKIGDLWIAREWRSQGIGAQLLAKAEAEIRERGHAIAALRVVATNTRAQAFYTRNGWREVRRYPHERFPAIEMVDFEKPLA